MDYDRYDAFLHHIFKQTQGDAWFRPNEDNIAVGVALRVDNGEYRVFPYENLGLEPFESAVRVLNPAVAVKVRSAAVHAAFAEVCVLSSRCLIVCDASHGLINHILALQKTGRSTSTPTRESRSSTPWSTSPLPTRNRWPHSL